MGSADDYDEPVDLVDVGDYESFLERQDLVLVDFHADWCGPCKMLEPIVAEIAEETDTTVLRVDIDAHQQLASEMGIRSVPTMHIYGGGELVEQMIGVQEKDRILDLLERAA
ncbi:MAG: thioredoxin family protein, partial [Halobacteriales archaeon]